MPWQGKIHPANPPRSVLAALAVNMKFRGHYTKLGGERVLRDAAACAFTKSPFCSEIGAPSFDLRLWPMALIRT